MCCLSNFPTDDSHMVVEWVNKQATKNDQLFSPQKFSMRLSLNCTVYGQLHHLAEITHSTSNSLSFENILQEFVRCTFWNLLCPRRRWV
jgi:hypothetical protein